MAGLKDIGIRRLLPKHIDYSKPIPQLKVTGSIDFNYTSPVTRNPVKRSAINIVASNNDVSIFRVGNWSPTSEIGNYGFNLFYSGSGTGENNKLVLMADNQNSLAQTEAFYINQSGHVYFGGEKLLIENSTGNIWLKDQAKIIFDNDSSNTYIAANADNPEDLEIHADDDIILAPDDDVRIRYGGTNYAKFDGSGKNLDIYHDTDAEYIALKVANLSNAADTTGKVSIQFDLTDTSDNNIIASKILVAKEQTFTTTTSTQDSKMEFHTSLNGTLSEKMTLSSGGNLSVDGTLACATSLTIGSAAMSEADLEKLDGITNGTVAANKAVVVDANLDASGFRAVHINRNATIGSIGSNTVANAGLRIQDTSTNMYIDGNSIFSVGGNFLINAVSNSDIKIGTNDTERMRIKADGKVGIGTTSPQHTLDVPSMGGLILSMVALEHGSNQTYLVTTSWANIASTYQTPVITFVAPASGNVELQISAYLADITDNAKVLYMSVGVDSTYNSSNSLANQKTVWQTDESDDITINTSWVLTGLTAGTSYTYYIAAKSSGSNNHTFYWGNSRQPFIIRAVALPSSIVTDN